MIYVRIYPKDHYVQVPWKYITDHFSKTLAKKVNNPKWPLDDLWLRICWCLMCDSTQGSVSKSHEFKVCGYNDPFFKNLNQRSFTPRWPLTPCLLRSHVWLYPRIIGLRAYAVNFITIWQWSWCHNMSLHTHNLSTASRCSPVCFSPA